jgi:hypothetical protein
MSQYAVQRPRHPRQIQRVNEQGRVADLPIPHELPKLHLMSLCSFRRLLLERAERPKLTLSLDDLFHGGSTEGAGQLLLQVFDAHVETESFHIGAIEVGAEPGPLQTAPKVALLCGVTETGQPDVQPPRAEPFQKSSDGLRTPDRHDGDALSVKVPTAPPSQGFERALVADPFNEHGCDQPLAVEFSQSSHGRHCDPKAPAPGLEAW